MNLKKIIVNIYIALLTVNLSIAANISNSSKNSEITNIKENVSTFSSIPNLKIINNKLYNYMINYNKFNGWYLGVQVDGIVGTHNSSSGAGTNFILGYSINKYLAFQYNHLVGKDLAGFAEGVINFNNSTAIIPYALGGTGWTNLTGQSVGAWDIGGGFKFKFSKHIQGNVNYRYIQTMKIINNSDISSRANTNIIGAGLTWFFNAKQDNINRNFKYLSSNYVKKVFDNKNINILKKRFDNIKYMNKCVKHFNLNKNSFICYKIVGNKIIIYLNTKFSYNKSYLDDKSKKYIKSFVKFIKNNNINKNIIIIKGYASQGRTNNKFNNYNQKLSKMRADNVRSYMKKLGIKNKIIIKSFGYKHTLKNIPKYDTRNQRVEIKYKANI